MEFNYFNKEDYPHWREYKLRHGVRSMEMLMVEVCDPVALTNEERQAIIDNCTHANISFYRSAKALTNSAELKTLGTQLGLYQLCDNPSADANKISHIEVSNDNRYIPYTDKALSWHTDGYYNTESDTVRSFIMHCVRPAERGGDNSYLDPELIYILLYDENPDYIAALSHPQAMTIPANEGERDECSVPVLKHDVVTGKLAMRYTERSRYITWHESCKTALAYLHTLLRETPYKLNYKLSANEGVICNNILHMRSAFSDSSEQHRRLLYRARYREAVGS